MRTLSFFELLERSGYALGDRWSHVWQWNRKLNARRLAESVGVPTPRLIQVGELDELNPPDMPFVLKSDEGDFSLSTFILEPVKGGYRDVRRDITASWSEWLLTAESKLGGVHKHYVAAGYDSPRIDGPWLIEEYLPDAEDWKCYAFDGEVMVVRQIVLPERTSRWWGSDWTDIGNIAPNRTYHPTKTAPPRDPEAVIDTASKVSKALGVPFCRVDVYDGGIFGEITPRPGGKVRFVKEWDRRMAAAWRRALERLS